VLRPARNHCACDRVRIERRTGELAALSAIAFGFVFRTRALHYHV
jgi:hypothetical protein